MLLFSITPFVYSYNEFYITLYRLQWLENTFKSNRNSLVSLSMEYVVDATFNNEFVNNNNIIKLRSSSGRTKQLYIMIELGSEKLIFCNGWWFERPCCLFVVMQCAMLYWNCKDKINEVKSEVENSPQLYDCVLLCSNLTLKACPLLDI